MFFSSKKDLQELVLVLDIRSSSVGAGILNISGEHTEVLYTTRTFEYFDKEQDSASFTATILKTLDRVLDDIKDVGISEAKVKNKNKPFERVFVMYASPWFVSHTKDVHFKKEKQFTFTKDHFKKLIQEELKADKKIKGVTPIEKDITNVTINGYQLDNPFDKKVKEIDFSFYISLMSEDSVEEVESMIQSCFHTDGIIHRTHPLVFFTVLRNTFINVNNFLFIDIGGEVTDIGLARNDSLVNIASMPFGKHYFIREIIEKCEIDHPTAVSAIRMISNDEIDAKCGTKTQKAIEVLKDEWLNKLNGALTTLSKKEALPNRIFVTVDNDLKPLFESILKSENMQNYALLSSEKTKITVLTSDILSSNITRSPKVRDDIFINLAGAFINSQKHK